MKSSLKTLLQRPSKNDNQMKGITSSQAQTLLKRYGPNDVQTKKKKWLTQYLAPLYSPISLMLLGAAILSLIDKKYFDFYFILGMYGINYAIQKWQEFKADKAIEVLQSNLDFKVATYRDESWKLIDSKELVPGDYIRLGLGSIIPADATVFKAENLSINESVLTGESLPKEKKLHDTIYSGSYIATGDFEALITHTGIHTKFGKTIFSIEDSKEKSLLEKDILSISRFLMIISLCSVFILSSVSLYKGFELVDLLTLDLSLIIAGVPIAMPAVMAIILSIGATGLSKKNVIVRRLSSLQDLANVDLLLTDKTGTLTKNEIQITHVVSYDSKFSHTDIVMYARYATSETTNDSIEEAIRNYDKDKINDESITTISFTPFDSERKHSTALLKIDEHKILISMGAPQVVEKFVHFKIASSRMQFKNDITKAAISGFRVLAVAIKKNNANEKNMQLIGLLFISDPLNVDAKSTLLYMKKHGIDVKMVTGDNILIAKRICKELNLDGEVLSRDETQKLYTHLNSLSKKFKNISAFAEVLPKDKYELVKACKKDYIVASTGDGINDLPALKIAHVGIAVSGAVTALKSMADIVLLKDGISHIQDALFESRKIFIRLYNYSVYRISESFRLVITILLLGLVYGFYPLVPIQIIILAFLNDIPIISLAVDKVETVTKPATIHARKRLTLSILFGMVGVMNSLLLFFYTFNVWHLSLPIIQTMFFLKLTVSGHMLIFVVHTKERWYTYLPSKTVMIAIFATQTIATVLAYTGWFMPAPISLTQIAIVWVWSFVWMQVGEVVKQVQNKIHAKTI